jgi:hypothetical protein
MAASNNPITNRVRIIFFNIFFIDAKINKNPAVKQGLYL